MLHQTAAPARRFYSRIKTPASLLVSWGCCGGHQETSAVADLSLGGVFIVTDCQAAAINEETHLKFLVNEGPIRAKAVVRHVDTGRGLGLEFTAQCGRDFSRLIGLINSYAVCQHKHRRT
jgi:PilZ domain